MLSLRSVLLSCGLRLGLLLGVLLACATGWTVPANVLLKNSRTAHGELTLITPTPEQMRHVGGREAGPVMLYFPESTGYELTVTLPVPAPGYYRVVGTHVFGAWKQGRYGQYQVQADGVPLPTKFNGWYGPAGPPANWPKARTHLVDINWGAIYLPGPDVRLTFLPIDGGLLGTEQLSLAPVQEKDLKPEELARRAPAPPQQEPPPEPIPPRLAVRDLGLPAWTISVNPRKITLDGKLKEWDFRNPAVTATAKTIKGLGWAAPAPQGDADLSATVQLAWDAQNLYLAAHVTDDELAETSDQTAWGSPWGCDSVVLRVLPPVWLRTGPRAVGQVAEDIYLGLSYYSPDTKPRELPGGAVYVSTRTKAGYDIEAAIPFTVMGFTAAAGDRIPFMLIFSDVDSRKAPNLRFDQYGLPTRGFGDRQVAQLRLLNADGWGVDLFLDHPEMQPGENVQLIGYLDVIGRAPSLIGVEFSSGGTTFRLPLPEAAKLVPGHRYEITGALTAPANLPAGRYDVRAVVTK